MEKMVKVYGVDELEEIISKVIDEALDDFGYKLNLLKKVGCEYTKLKKTIIVNIMGNKFTDMTIFKGLNKESMTDIIRDYVNSEIDFVYTHSDYIKCRSNKSLTMGNAVVSAIYKEVPYIIDSYKFIEEVYENTEFTKTQLITHIKSELNKNIANDIKNGIIASDDVDSVYRYANKMLEKMRRMGDSDNDR